MRPHRERVWHNVRPNEITRMCRSHVVLTTATHQARRGKTGVQTWRLACATFHKGAKGRETKYESRDYRNPNALWRDVSDRTGTSGRTIVWAHNLSDAIRITRVFEQLPALGWKLTGYNITTRACWMEWQRSKTTLLLIDSLSFFPTTLDQIGNWHGIGTAKLDSDCDDDADWLVSCRRNNRILYTQVAAYLEWLEAEDMGNFQITGPAQSWATYRHRFLSHKLTVHDESDILAAERRAMWAGRCEAYWRGELKGERVYEFDFSAAYPRIARDYALPVKLVGRMPDAYNWRNVIGSQHTGLLAQITVSTSVPVLPTSHNSRILWPTGTFQTTVWDVEIEAALKAGATITVHRGWLYRKQPALAAWGTWILEQLAMPDDIVPAWQKAVLKHWSRALIGRFAMTYNRWEPTGVMPHACIQRGVMYDAQTHVSTDIMQVGRDVWEDLGREEWQHSMPMITGYVQAIGRVQLWDILQALGDRKALYVDTDSILTTAKFAGDLERIARSYTKGVLRLKRAWDGFSIYGPRQIVTGHQVRVSGIPRNAQQVDRTHYTGERRDSLPHSLRNGTWDRVLTRDVSWEVKGVDHRRTGTGFGWTEPVSVGP